MQREWRELDEFPDYAVSEFGEVTNMKTGMERKTSVNQQGIRTITLYQENGCPATRSLAVLVASAFVPPAPQDHFDTVIHLDGDRTNCQVSNLAWRPRWFAIRFHKQFQHEQLYADKGHWVELRTGTEFFSMLDVVRTFGIYHIDVVNSHFNGTPVFPGDLRFELVLE